MSEAEKLKKLESELELYWKLFIASLIGFLLASVMAVVLFIHLPPEITLAHWLNTLLFFCIPGAFGGILSLGSRQQENDSASPTWRQILLAVLSGIGGSIAGLALTVLSNTLKIPTDTEKERLSWICIGALTGFVGFRLLKAVSDQLAKRMTRTEKKAAEAEKKSAEAEKKSAEAEKKSAEAGKISAEAQQQVQLLHEKMLKNAALDNYVRDVCNDLQISHSSSLLTPTKLITHIEKLGQMRESFPDHRSSGIVLARLYQERNEIERAIRVLNELEEAIKKREPKSAESDIDTADLCYNRAFYYTKIEKKNEAISDAKRSFSLLPLNIVFARTDVDYDVVFQKCPELLDHVIDQLVKLVKAEKDAVKKAGLLLTQAGYRARLLREEKEEKKAKAIRNTVQELLKQMKGYSKEDYSHIQKDRDFTDFTEFVKTLSS